MLSIQIEEFINSYELTYFIKFEVDIMIYSTFEVGIESGCALVGFTFERRKAGDDQIENEFFGWGKISAIRNWTQRS